jgi:hypothetical protein
MTKPSHTMARPSHQPSLARLVQVPWWLAVAVVKVLTRGLDGRLVSRLTQSD